MLRSILLTIALLVSAFLFVVFVVMPLSLGYWYMCTEHESFTIGYQWWISAFVALIVCGGLFWFTIKKFLNVGDLISKEN